MPHQNLVLLMKVGAECGGHLHSSRSIIGQPLLRSPWPYWCNTLVKSLSGLLSVPSCWPYKSQLTMWTRNKLDTMATNQSLNYLLILENKCQWNLPTRVYRDFKIKSFFFHCCLCFTQVTVTHPTCVLHDSWTLGPPHLNSKPSSPQFHMWHLAGLHPSSHHNGRSMGTYFYII